MELVPIGEAARITGLHPQTLRGYAKTGRIPVYWTPGGAERRFSKDDLHALMGLTRDTVTGRVEAHYLRVSGTTGQESSLADQEKRLAVTASGRVYRVYKDTASGLSEKRRGLTRLLVDAAAEKFTVVRVVHIDRLARFGASWIEDLLAAHGVTLETLDDVTFRSPHEELMADFMSLVASFSGRFYKMRSLEAKRRLLDDASKRLGNPS